MRARFVTNQLDRMFTGYGVFDEAPAAIGSGSSFFAFDTADFTWLNGAYESSYDAATARFQTSTDLTGSEIELVQAGPLSGSTAKLSAAPPASVDTTAAPSLDFTAEIQTASAAAIVSNGDILPTSVMPTSIEFIDFSLYPQFEPASSLLDVIGIGALSGIAQGDSVFLLNESPGFSFVSFDVSEVGGLTGGRNAFDPVVYLKGDIDGDGVQDYLIRVDETGPTLMGTDYPI